MGETREAAGPGRGDDGEPSGGSWSLFGDPTGLAVALGALCVTGLTWQVGFFITDSYAIGNALLNVADGHLSIERLYYSLTLGSQPGFHVVDGELFARNYGQVFLALPAYFVLDALAGVAPLSLLVAGLWALTAVAFARQAARVAGRRWVQTAGSAVALAVFLASASTASPLDRELAGLVALQVVSMAAAAVTALAVYRLVRFSGDRQTALVAAGATLLGTPLWFWAAVPKRHVLTAAVVATLLFWFAASRRPGPRAPVPLPGVDATVPKSVALRASGYALAGLLTWTHAFEGLLVLAAFGCLDLLTASSTSRRAALALALALAAGLAPTLATNAVVSGNPAEPPRLTPKFFPGSGDVRLGPGGTVETVADEPASGGSTTGSESGVNAGSEGGTPADRGGTETADSDGRESTGSSPENGSGGQPAVGVLGWAVRNAEGLPYVSNVRSALAAAPTKLYHTYVRSGNPAAVPDPTVNRYEPVNLALLEAVPLYGGVVGLVVAGALWLRVRVRALLARLRDAGSALFRFGTGRPRGAVSLARIRQADPARLTGALAAAFALGFSAMYFPFLPTFSQLTVRYLLPVAPAAAYLLVRFPPVAVAVRSSPRWLVGSYLTAAVAGLAAVALAVPVLDPAVGEAMQLHAIVNLALCALVAAVTTLPVVGLDLDTRTRATALGAAAAGTAVLVVAMQFSYFEYGTYAVPAVRALADLLPALP